MAACYTYHSLSIFPYTCTRPQPIPLLHIIDCTNTLSSIGVYIYVGIFSGAFIVVGILPRRSFCIHCCSESVHLFPSMDVFRQRRDPFRIRVALLQRAAERTARWPPRGRPLAIGVAPLRLVNGVYILCGYELLK